ncbi:hypothetical protein ACJIZ3_024928 [Penstemon smallii]|uniref:Uncharacterized protein n=1 Tax=Penstemon smallii TaxID=265156 RepID=A0ABD3TVW1_9LAMI
MIFGWRLVNKNLSKLILHIKKYLLNYKRNIYIYIYISSNMDNNFIIYNIYSGVFLGIDFISLSLPPILANSTGTCQQYEPSSCIGHTQKGLFYTGMALVAIGISGHRPTVLYNVKSSTWKLLLSKHFVLGLLFPIIGTLVLPLSKLWWVYFGIPAICIAIATLLFLTRWCAYNKNNKPQGSPLTNVCRVFVACASKISQPLPVYKEDDDQERQSFPRTRYLRWLEKATIDTSPENEVKYRWKHCSVTEVEEAKIAVRMVPMWMMSIICGVVSSIGNTYFLEQANHLSREIGKIEVPLPVMLLFLTWVKSLCHDVDHSHSDDELIIGTSPVLLFGPAANISNAILYSVICCMAAAGVEIRRLNVIKRHALLDKPDEDIPMSIFWLVFQFFLLGVVESFFEKGISEFYLKEAPNSMKKYFSYFTKGVSGLGFMFSVLSVYVVGKISESGGKPNWFQFTLNRSRLDRYYWVLAALSCFNLLMFKLVASRYKYKKSIRHEAVQESLAEN